MTELVEKFIKESKKITEEDVVGAIEVSFLVLVFVFCVYAVSPIV
jgi:hypothetical protein